MVALMGSWGMGLVGPGRVCTQTFEVVDACPKLAEMKDFVQAVNNSGMTRKSGVKVFQAIQIVFYAICVGRQDVRICFGCLGLGRLRLSVEGDKRAPTVIPVF